MDAVLKPERKGGKFTTLKIERDLHRQLRKAAKSRHVQIGSLTEYLLTSGLEQIDRGGLPLPIAS